MNRVIPNNAISLSQNGEDYFPAVEAALDRAVHEIYLESYFFKNDGCCESPSLSDLRQ